MYLSTPKYAKLFIGSRPIWNLFYGLDTIIGIIILRNVSAISYMGTFASVVTFW